MWPGIHTLLTSSHCDWVSVYCTNLCSPTEHHLSVNREKRNLIWVTGKPHQVNGFPLESPQTLGLLRVM